MKNVYTYVSTLDLSNGETHRGTCPTCGGKNTFTVTKNDGSLLWNCYKAGCPTSGGKNEFMTADEVIESMQKDNEPENYEEVLCTIFEKEPYMVPVDTSKAYLRSFLQKWNIEPRDVWHDVRQDRIVFPVLSLAGDLMDAVGRSVINKHPKWLRYNASPVPYSHGLGNTAVVVEDAISAYTIGQLYQYNATGVALLGTQLTDFHKWYIANFFDNAIIALDPDAIDKTVKITKELRGYMDNVLALVLNDDLKYKNEDDLDQLEDMLDGRS